MELLETWHRLEKEKLSKPVLGAVQIAKKSRHPVARLKIAFRNTVVLSALCFAGFVFLFFLFSEPLVKIGIGAVVGAYIFFFVVNFDMYRKISAGFPATQTLRAALKYTHTYISDNIRFQERISLFIYPIAGTAGFIMGGAVGSGDINSMMMKPVVLILMVVFMAVVTPLCFYLTRWLYSVSYGKCLAELKTLIDDLEQPN